MKITWSLPVRGERLESSRGDLVRARRLIERLRAEGHDLRVVEYATLPGASLAVSAYRRLVSRVIPRPLALILRDLGRWLESRRHARRVAWEARKQGADVILETQVGFAGSGASAARLTGLPFVLEDCSPSSEEAVLGCGLPGLAKRILRRQLAAASMVVVSTRALREILIQDGVPAKKLHVVPNGVDARAYSALDPEGVRERLGLSRQCVIGFVGSFQPWHATELVVHALAQLARWYPLHLVLVGDGPTRKSTLDAVRRLGLDSSVTAIPAVPPDRIPGLISAFHIGVLPGSNDYGHPVKLMEYAAAGIPSVAPDLPSVREVVQDGLSGLLFPPGDLGGLVAALALLIQEENLRTRLGDTARRTITAEASWSGRGRDLASLLERLLGDQGRTVSIASGKES